MIIDKFEDVIAWQKARQLTLRLYSVLKSLKDFGFRDQIWRASVSIMNNIAEGFERKGHKEFSRFLFIAKGSCAEVRSMLYLAKDLNYISEDEFNFLYNQTMEISKLIGGFIRSLK